ncbi:MAG: gliding-motility protein MglA [Chloroflexi bacterium]|nr:gliding-motility protein MglA [Chloroflexota bacterium]MBP8054647.1 gliding-motility protein MglA [Chloroflexota bacterium]
MHINWQLRKLNLKIVYYGPALSGKTTNLEQIHRSVDPKRRSDLVSLKTHEDRTLYFDFLQLELGKIAGLTPQIQLYTVPGQAYYEASRRVVLRGADGVVFVADSLPARLRANRESWEKMEQHLASFGIALPHFPLVVQFNKQDLPGALPMAVLQNLLRVNQMPVMAAAAIKGQGVLESLKAITKAVIHQVQQEMGQASNGAAL